MGLAVAGKVAAAGVAFPALPAGVRGGVAFPAAATAAALGPKEKAELLYFWRIFCVWDWKLLESGNYPTLEPFHLLTVTS
jgi:hypothetical protein